MAAPTGRLREFDAQPRALMVVDRSLRETSAEEYHTVGRLRRPGRYNVVFFLDSPRTAHCFEVEVEPDPLLDTKRHTG